MADVTVQGTIESQSDFETNPRGLQERWTVEVTAGKKELKKWHATARKLIDRFLDKRSGSANDDTRLNLFSANLQTQRALMYGKTPRVDVARRFEDPKDKVGRVAAEILQRCLNTSIEKGSDDYKAALAQALDDRLLVGLGMVRLRYEAEFEEQEEVPAQLDDEGVELAPAYTPEPIKTFEDVKVDYVHWSDVIWSPCRTWGELRWVGFRAYLTVDQLKERFGAEKAKQVPLSKKANDRGDTVQNDPWQRAAVYEIWSKDDEKVYWFAEGMEQILDVKDDPLGLDGFFPFPRPLLANATNDSFMPRPDFIMAQDLYNEIDYVSTRITLLERAVKVVGVYDRSAEGVRRMLTEGFDNDLVPVDNWALFAERGGLKGQVDWMPIDQVVAAMDKLRDYRAELIKLTYEVTGMSDIMRGEQQAGETATTSALKAKFASVRLQSAQDEFARFASDTLRIKAEILCRHADDQLFITESNASYMFDAELVEQALQLLRSDLALYRIEVKPENISMQDFDMMKAERTSFIQGFTQFLMAAGPMIEKKPEAAPFLLEMLKWGLAGFRGSSTIEGVIDQAVGAMQTQAQQPQPPQQDPKAQAEMARAQADIMVTKTKAQTDMQTAQAKARLDLNKQAQSAQIDLQKAALQARMQANAAAERAANQPALTANGRQVG